MSTSARGHTRPKRQDLAEDGSYVPHAFLGDHDEEFQVSGFAELITDEVHRARVHEAIRFPSYDAEDPVFRLRVSRALWSTWIPDRDP